MAISRRHRLALLQCSAIVACSIPAILLGIASWQSFAGGGAPPPPLGANPVETLERETGIWALRLLVLSLAVTPLRRLGWKSLAPLRRTLGLAAFSYAALHLAIFVGLDLGFDFAAVAEDLQKRPYIAVGFAAFTILLALAATSTQSAMKRLGRRWNRLHRAVYVAAGLAVLHFAWLVKADYSEPIFYGSCIGILLAARGIHSTRLRLAGHARAGDS